MIIEFDTVRVDMQEQHQKNIDRESLGEASVPFLNERDYIGKIAIDMNDIVDFEESMMYCNNRSHSCVFASFNDNRESTTRNLLIHYDDFKTLFEKVHGVKVKSYRDFIDEV